MLPNRKSAYLNDIYKEIETFIKTLSNTKRLAPVVFDNWKFSLLDLVNKVEKYSPSIKHNKSKSIFQDPDAKIELNKLQHSSSSYLPIGGIYLIRCAYYRSVKFDSSCWNSCRFNHYTPKLTFIQ